MDTPCAARNALAGSMPHMRSSTCRAPGHIRDSHRRFVFTGSTFSHQHAIKTNVSRQFPFQTESFVRLDFFQMNTSATRRHQIHYETGRNLKFTPFLSTLLSITFYFQTSKNKFWNWFLLFDKIKVLFWNGWFLQRWKWVFDFKFNR